MPVIILARDNRTRKPLKGESGCAVKIKSQHEQTALGSNMGISYLIAESPTLLKEADSHLSI